MSVNHSDQNLRFAILLNAIPGARVDRELHKAHAEHLRKLDEAGKLVIAGPYIEHNSGIIIVRADSKEEAENLAKSDPFVVHGYRSYEIRTLEICCLENNYRKPQ